MRNCIVREILEKKTKQPSEVYFNSKAQKKARYDNLNKCNKYSKMIRLIKDMIDTIVPEECTSAGHSGRTEIN